MTTPASCLATAVVELASKLEIHPAASAFPVMVGDAFEALVQDIRERGLVHPITLHEGRILDGRNRYLACRAAGVEPRFVSWDGRGGSPTLFVVSENIHRRHLTPSQRAMLVQELLPALEAEAREPQGARTNLGRNSYRSPGRSRERAAMAVGVSPDSIAVAKKVATARPDLAEKIRIGETSLNAAERQIAESAKAARRAANADLVRATPAPTVVLGRVRFATIVIDPPWDWHDEGYESEFGRKQPPYATMRLDAIRALPVAELADEDSHIYLWATNRILVLGHAHALLQAWGFRFGSLITWEKPGLGLGSYFRNNTEPCVFGVRGQQALLRHDVGTHFLAPPGPRGHSSKPLKFYDLVEGCSPGPFIEMFARGGREGWTSWGAEAAAGAGEATP